MPDDEMPERPRTHVLGSKAVRAFVNMLPSEWVVREPGDDYGIDAEIEVFTGGRATGFTFKVQSKGTDSPGTLTRKVKRKTLNYWRSLDVPVLVVLWDSSANRLLCRWAHTIGSDKPLRVGSRKVTVRFDPANEVAGDWAQTLPDYLESYRSLKLGYLPFPLPISLEVDAGSDVDGPAVRAELQRIFSRAGSPTPFVLSPPGPHAVSLRIERQRLSARMPLDIASASITQPDVPTETPQQLAMDLLVTAATAMAAINGEIASHLARAGGPFSQQWRQPESAERSAHILAHPDNTHLTSWVLQLLHDDDLAVYAYDIYLVAADRSIKLMTDEDFERMSTSMRDDLDSAAERATEIVDGAERLAVQSNLGRRYFNLANMHRRRRGLDPALECLTIAVALEPRYETAAHFHGVLAEVHWYRKDYEVAAQAYGRAIELGEPDPDRMRVLRIDALVRAGAFAVAVDELVSWSPTGDWHDRVGVINTGVLAAIGDRIGLDTQTRRPLTEDEWNELTDNGERYLTAEEALEVLHDRDATDPNLWIVVAAHADLASSFSALLVAAAMMENDVGLWASAAIAAIESGQDEQLVVAIVDSALFETKGAFYDALSFWAFMPEEPEGSDHLSTDHEGKAEAITSVPEEAPMLRIDAHEMRGHSLRLLGLARARLELVPQLGLGMSPRPLNSDDPSAPLIRADSV